MEHSYFVFFPVMVVEGPIVTVIAGFLASLGYFNLIYLYPLAILGDLVGDTIYYALGRWGGRHAINKWAKYLGFNPEHISKVEKLFHHHGGKTLLLGKITQVVGSAVLVAAGVAKMPYKRFLYLNAIITIPKSLLLVLIGYYFGRSYAKINGWLDITILFSLIILIILFFVYRKKIIKFFYEDTLG
jgi:membrane protein DedA with SNARE-associated domain